MKLHVLTYALWLTAGLFEPASSNPAPPTSGAPPKIYGSGLETFYRGDSRPPSAIKEQGGFRTRGPPKSNAAFTLKNHVENLKGSLDTIYVSTAESIGPAIRFATARKTGYVYKIQGTPNAVDVNKSYRQAGQVNNKYETQLEHAFAGGIGWTQIRGWEKVNMQGTKVTRGAFEPNPDYDHAFDAFRAAGSQPQLLVEKPGKSIRDEATRFMTSPHNKEARKVPGWAPSYCGGASGGPQKRQEADCVDIYAPPGSDQYYTSTWGEVELPSTETEPLPKAPEVGEPASGIEPEPIAESNAEPGTDLQEVEEEEETSVGDVLNELSPVKPLTDLVAAIRSDKPVSLGQWLMLGADILLMAASLIPTPAAPAFQALKIARAALKTTKAVKKVLGMGKRVAQAGRSVQRAQKAVNRVEQALESSRLNVVKEPTGPGTSVGNVVKTADKIKAPANQPGKTSFLSEEKVNELLKKLDDIVIPSDPIRLPMENAARSAGAGTKTPVALPGKRAATPHMDMDAFADDIAAFADFISRKQPVPAELLDRMAPQFEVKLAESAGQPQEQSNTFLNNDMLFNALAEEFYAPF